MNIYCIRHVAFEGPGIIEDWARSKAIDFHTVKLFDGESLPAPDSVDALVIMGGPMSVNDEAEYPWLADEKELIRKLHHAGKPVLGICLGAQLLAAALFSSVYRNGEKEIGWFPVSMTPEGLRHPLTRSLPEEFTTFHWHGDTFDLPDEAQHLIGSEACANQAFAIGRSLGLQFHMEMTEDGIREVSERCAHELVKAPYIQSRDQMMNSPEMAFNHAALRSMLDVWVSG